jgi:hypothetical protein
MFIIFASMISNLKNRVLFKIVVGLPVLLFIDYLIMVILGCASCLLGFGDSYFCGTYCLFGKGLLLLSFLLYGGYLYQDLRGKAGKSSVKERRQQERA